MAKEKNEEQPLVFHIPNNFIDEGKILGGMFRTRNAVEAIVVMVVICYPLFNWINFDFTTKICIAIVGALPIAILALIGLNDGPLSEFIKDFYKYITATKDIKYRLSPKTEGPMKGEKKDEKPVK